MVGSRKYELPPFLARVSTQAVYERWLHRRAAAQVGRDRNRGNPAATLQKYKLAIHEAVLISEGRDYYTGEVLDWTLLSRYNNLDSQIGRRQVQVELWPHANRRSCRGRFR